MWAKITTIKRTKDLNYFSLCALNLFNTRVSQFELNYWNKGTFPRHTNLLRCTCTWHSASGGCYCFTCLCCFYLPLQLPCQTGSWMDVGLREDVKWMGLALRAQMEAASTPRTARLKRGECLALSKVNVKELVGPQAGNSSWECTFKGSWRREYENRSHYSAIFSDWDFSLTEYVSLHVSISSLFSRKWQSGKNSFIKRSQRTL